jgi:diacylglycerol kinase (ATP)
MPSLGRSAELYLLVARSALLIANKRSRRCAELKDQAVAAFADAGMAVTVPDLPEKQDVPQFIRDHAPAHDCIVTLGGDGTINTALPGILDAGKPLGVLAGGTANDFVRSMGLPSDVADAVRVIAEGHLRTVDVATVNDHLYLNAASLGLTVGVSRRLDPAMKKRWGVLAYAVTAWRVLRQARGFGVEITDSDGRQTTLRSMQLVVGNGRHFGGMMTVDADAQIDDGLLHLYSVRALSWWRLLLIFPALRLGNHDTNSNVHNVAGERFSLRTRRPKEISADGEILTRTPAEFAVHKRVLQVYALRPT